VVDAAARRAARAGRYIDLVGGKKPHLLASVQNGVGLETRLAYAPSTKAYLADRAAGRPWATRLHFPVHVLARSETYDAVRRVRFVSEYRYRDGYFDADEREFRGFAYVEQWDTEYDPALSGKGLFADRPPPVNGELPQPPVVTRSWFHVGAWPDTDGAVLPDGLSPAEARDACRALKGQLRRQEILAHDGTPLENEPYTVTETHHEVRLVQPARGPSPAVFFTHPREVIERHTERDPGDPRVQHTLNLEVDECGHVRRSVAIGYPRRNLPDRREEQRALAMTMSELEVANELGHDDWHRHGVALSGRTYELTGLAHDGEAAPFTFEQVHEAATAAVAIAYEEKPTSGKREKRLVESSRTRYFDSRSIPEPLPFGRVDALALTFETYGLAFTPSLVASLYGGRVTDDILAEGGYVHLDDDGWWVASGRAIPNGPFHLPTEFRDPFGNRSAITYDGYALLVTASRDAKGNLVRVENDYRTMGPSLVVDANENRVASEVDALGRVVASWMMGKPGSSDGDPRPGSPTTTFEYSFYDPATGRPSCVHSAAREIHGAADSKWQHAYVYSDGGGHEVMTKAQAEPAPGTTAPRWVGNGRTVVDNKGQPIKQYEPFFSATHGYESDEELVEHGVTPILHYDPVGRLVRSELPDGNLLRVKFTPWREESWDANDTVLDPGNVWYAAHAASPDPMQRRAAVLAARHGGTPSVTILDALGRACAAISDAGQEGKLETKTTLDIEGNPLVVQDGLGNVAMTRAFSLLGQACRHQSASTGERWTLVNVSGLPLRSWDARGHCVRSTYDELQRPTHLYVRDAGGVERLAQRTEYGEAHPEAARLNLRGKVYRRHDGAGEATHDAYDFKGNPLSSTRRFAVEHREPIDWAASPPPVLEEESFTEVTAFDALNRPTSVRSPDGSERRPTYNEAGLLDKVEMRLRGAAEWTTFVGNIEYSAKGQRERIVYGENTAATAYEHDPLTYRLRRLTTQRSLDGNRLQDLRYTYDPVGDIVAIADDAQAEVFFGGGVVDGAALYEYDPVHRLVRAEGREHAGAAVEIQREDRELPLRPLPHRNDGQALRRYVEEYRYDAAGNIREMKHAAAGSTAASWTRTYDYLAGGNRLDATHFSAESSPARYPHDDHGNMTAMPHLPGIEWDFKDQMQRVDKGGGGVVTFVYDADGQRVRKIWEHGGLVEERMYLGGYEVYRRRRGRTVVLERQTLHVVDDGQRVALVETKTIDVESSAAVASRVRFQLGNHLGSATLEIDDAGRLISYEEFHPYGTTSYRAAASGVEVSAKRYRYTGKERDEETGLYYHGARYYAPWLARWTSSDPSGLADGANTYAYVKGNPINLHDPTGRLSDKIKAILAKGRQEKAQREEMKARRAAR
jgi:RHS repeat-associated protein